MKKIIDTDFYEPTATSHFYEAIIMFIKKRFQMTEQVKRRLCYTKNVVGQVIRH